MPEKNINYIKGMNYSSKYKTSGIPIISNYYFSQRNTNSLKKDDNNQIRNNYNGGKYVISEEYGTSFEREQKVNRFPKNKERGI